MTNQSLASLFPAIGIAAFERTPDGAFMPLTPPPEWFRRLADVTFPFLGHILEEANEFWRSREPGSRDFGPCAEVDATGREFHYKVTAVTAPDNQYLLFQLDHASDQMRQTLQVVRDQRLALEQESGAMAAMLTEARRAADEIHEAVIAQRQLIENRHPDDWLVTLSTHSAELVKRLEDLSRVLS